SPGVAKELPITWTKGIRQISAKPLSMITLTTRNTLSPRVSGRRPLFDLRDLRGGVLLRTALATVSVAGAEVLVMRGAHPRSGEGRSSPRPRRTRRRQGRGSAGCPAGMRDRRRGTTSRRTGATGGGGRRRRR